MNTPRTIVEVKELKKIYMHGEQETQALRGVSLIIRQGEFTSIMGPSGSGKSTLMHLIGGLDRPSAGSVLIDGKAIEKFSDDELSAFRRRKLGFIFQAFNLLPTLTAIENVALPMLLDGQSMATVHKKAAELMDFMGLGHRLNHRPDQLSGGQMQRVAIARALVTDPLIIMADEPTGNLDSETGASVLSMLARLVRERGQTVVMVTHDPKAASYGTRLVRVCDGRIESDVAVPQRTQPVTGHEAAASVLPILTGVPLLRPAAEPEKAILGPVQPSQA